MKLDELFALLRRRGVLWPTAEIYGGVQGLYDYGPLGARLKERIEKAWEAWFLGLSEDYHRIAPAEILPEAVVRASGHLEMFTDPEVTCGKCHASFRADTLLEKLRPDGVEGLSPEQIGELVRHPSIRCPNCGSTELSVPRPFNLMFPLGFGVANAEKVYLQPETAQASYLAFARMWDVGRRTLPLGIANIAHAYRNEISPRQLLFRMRAFTQAELQIFFDPADFPVPFEAVADRKIPLLRAHDREAGRPETTWRTARELEAEGEFPRFFLFHLVHLLRFYEEVFRFEPARIRLYEKSARERAFYNRLQFDLEVSVESLGGFRELAAIHYRGDYDLGRHSKGSGRDLAVTPTNRPKVLPHVLELTFGVDRNLWALADLHLRSEDERTRWALPAYLAPTPVGVFPLLKKEHGERARAIAEMLREAGVPAVLDAAGTIGKRYARMDEMGTPFTVTVDGETLAAEGSGAGTVTLRDRDSRAQERLPPDRLAERVARSLRPPRPAYPEPPPGPEATAGASRAEHL